MGDKADDYLLAVVLYAAARFQLGIQSRIGVFELRLALVIVSGGIVVGTTLWILTSRRSASPIVTRLRAGATVGFRVVECVVSG